MENKVRRGGLRRRAPSLRRLKRNKGRRSRKGRAVRHLRFTTRRKLRDVPGDQIELSIDGLELRFVNRVSVPTTRKQFTPASFESLRLRTHQSPIDRERLFRCVRFEKIQKPGPVKIPGEVHRGLNVLSLLDSLKKRLQTGERFPPEHVDRHWILEKHKRTVRLPSRSGRSRLPLVVSGVPRAAETPGV